MKKVTKIFGLMILCMGILFSACSDMLDITSDRNLLTEDNKINSVNDSPYSTVGILKLMRGVAEQYAVLGELRADLVDTVYGSSNINLIKVNNIDYSKGENENENNPYYSTRGYYSIINNCNYFIHNVDTTVIFGGEEVLMYEYAAVKALRAWTYMQLALNFGKVPYITEPILTVDDMNKEYESYTLYELADTLIKDIERHETLSYPDLSSSSGLLGNYSFIPIPFLVGDLHLWKGEYDEAASWYHKLIEYYEMQNKYRLDSVSGKQNRWVLSPNTAEGGEFTYWPPFYSGSVGTEVGFLISDRRAGSNTEVVNLEKIAGFTNSSSSEDQYTYEIAPSKVALNNWEEEMYTFQLIKGKDKIIEYFPGDLRGNLSKMYGVYNRTSTSFAYNYQIKPDGDTVAVIQKYQRNYVYPYRYMTLLLRYAEAVNAKGIPSLAMTALKYGLSNRYIQNPEYVSPEELENAGNPGYADFNFIPNESENKVVGIHSRGAGRADLNEYYILPDTFPDGTDLTLQQRQKIVDGYLLKELALETGFEGNRFHDLMRFAYREKSVDGSMDAMRNIGSVSGPNILSEAVRAKNTVAASKLENSKNWFIPTDYLTFPDPIVSDTGDNDGDSQTEE